MYDEITKKIIEVGLTLFGTLTIAIAIRVVIFKDCEMGNVKIYWEYLMSLFKRLIGK